MPCKGDKYVSKQGWSNIFSRYKETKFYCNFIDQKLLFPLFLDVQQFPVNI
jgi:hypothetical protein